jgi:hypothetical protein
VKKNRKTSTHSKLCGFSVTGLFAVCGTLSFILGFHSVSEVHPVMQTTAQETEVTMVNVILQYKPVSGGSPVPIEVTPFMNASQTALLQLQEVHTGVVFPSNPFDRCLTTNSVGRCNIEDVPVGPDTDIGLTVDQQYDVIVDTVFLEFLTDVPLESGGAYVRYSPNSCNGDATFSIDTSQDIEDSVWCLSKSGEDFAEEYFLTITLQERNICLESSPPAPYCSVDGGLVNFTCNPSFSGPTSPWEPDTSACSAVQCPDGNNVSGACTEVSEGLSACSTAVACAENQLCSVLNFGSSVEYLAGEDSIVIRGERFGNLGGAVSYSADGGGVESVQVSAGPDWTDTEVRVRIPLNAISGPILIHPNSHGSTDQGSSLVPVTCESPEANIRAFKDQFSILSLNGFGPQGVSLVSPGFESSFTIIAHHNDSVGRLSGVDVELVEGAFTDPDSVPLSRTVVANQSCPVQVTGSLRAKEATIECIVPIPESANAVSGPFTFIVSLYDDQGGTARAVLLDSGSSDLAGDFNLDGTLSIEDAVVSYRISNGSASETSEHRRRDVDGDGNITLSDSLSVLHSLTE